MSDSELPEIESGKLPLFVIIFIGIVALFFIGLLVSVFQRGDGRTQQAETPPGGFKEQPVLLGPEEKFRVRFQTSAGSFVMEVRPDWAPRGATQFRELVEAGFYDECRFFRVVPDFMVQFGINADPKEHSNWSEVLQDDEVKQTNGKGKVTFATSGDNTRSTQLFINLKNNAFLDEKGFSPIGEIVEGMENVEKIYAEDREKPEQLRIESEGNIYLLKEFPKLDYINSVEIIE